MMDAALRLFGLLLHEEFIASMTGPPAV
jgi:hypothetical protein